MLAGIRRKSFLVWGVAPAVLIIMILWCQFGFSMGATLEEWDFLWLIDHHPTFWTSFPGNLMSETFAARPLQVLPFRIARAISSNSFAGFNLLLMAACFVRVIAGVWIGFFLFRSRAYAAAAGLLFLTFPADTQQLAFRTINVSCAVALMSAGVALVLNAITARRSGNRRSLAALSVVLCVVATFIYEPVLTLYSLPLLFIWAKYGARNTAILLKHRKRFALAWCIAPVINAAYLYYAMEIYGSSYQTNAAAGGMLKAILASAPYLVNSLAYRVFFDAWTSSWWIVTTQIAHYKFIAASCIVLAALMLFLSWRERQNPSVRLQIRIIASGLIALVAGYVPYMVASTHMEITQRTFMSVAPGASIVLIGLIALASQRQVIIGAAISCAFILVSMVAQLYQFDRYARDYTGISLPYMSFVADRVDQTKTVHLVMDSSGFGGHLTGMYTSKISTGIPARLGDVKGTYFLCADQQSSPYIALYTCALKDGTWIVSMNGKAAAKYPATLVQAISVDKSLDLAYRSRSMVWRDQGSFVPAKSMFVTDDPQVYSCVADSMWGWSGFCRGNGWSDGIFNHPHLVHQNFFGAVAPTTSLIFNLQPESSPYTLALTMLGGIDGAIVPAMKIAINGVPVAYRATSALAVEASVPSSALKSGQNEITFENVLPAGRDLGLLLTRVDLKPGQ